MTEDSEMVKWVCLAGAISVVAYCAYLAVASYSNNQIAIEKMRLENSKPKYVLQEADFNKNGKPETFYVINGEKAFVKEDGQSIEDRLK